MKKLAALVALGLLLAAAAPAGATTTVKVTGNTVDESAGENGSTGWWFNRDQRNVTPYSFVHGEATTGAGSLYVAPIGSNPADKFVGELFLFSAVESISFDYLTADPAKNVYLNVYANTPATAAVAPGNFYECRFDFVATVNGAWATLSTETTAPAVVKRAPYGGPCVLDDMVVRAASINVGVSTATDVGVDAHLDDVVVTTAAGTTAYDFEPVPTNKDQCKDGGWIGAYENQGQCVRAFTRG